VNAKHQPVRIFDQTRNLERKRADTKLNLASGDGTFSGYASLFEKVDLGKDKIARGAFKKALQRQPAQSVRMLFQHDPSVPIGCWTTIREDQKGLWVEGRIVQDTPKGKEILELLRAGAIDGLSIGFKTVKSKTDKSSGIRTVHEADLWEISVVTFPMLPQARVDQVKSTSELTIQNRRLPSTRQFERWLTRDAGLTRSEAKTVICSGFSHLTRVRDAVCEDPNPVAESIKRATQKINARR